MPEASYYHSIDVLPPDLADEAYRYLGISRKVTFGHSNRAYTKTERLLSEDIVDRIREELDQREIMSGRTVLFGPFRDQILRLPGDNVQQARALADRGFSLLVIADALGYSYNTLRRWGLPKGRQVYQPHGTDDELALLRAAGEQRVREVRPYDVRSPKSQHYLLVGSALAWLEQVV